MMRTICFPLLGRTVGGSHHSTLLLAANLDSSRYKPLIVTHEDGLLAPLIAQYGLEARKLPLPYIPRSAKDLIFPRWKDWAASIGAVKSWLAQEKPDAVQLDDGPLRYLWQPAAYANHVPYIHYQRTPPHAYDPEKLLRYPQCDLVLCNSQYTHSTMPPTVSLRSYVVTPPIDLDARISRPAAREALLQKYGLAPDVVIIGYLANLQKRKRPHLIPEIAAALRDQHVREVVFLMTGTHYDAAAKRTVDRVAQIGLEKQVIFAGYNDRPLEFLAGCDMLIAPAVNEAFGRTLIEAMFAGTFVIASNAGGHREIIRSGINGVLIPPDDVKAFANCIAASCRSADTCAAMVAQAKIDAGKYALKPHVQRMMSLYDAMFAQKDQKKEKPDANAA